MSLIVSFLSPSTHHIPLTVIYFLFCGAQLQNYLYVYFYLGSQNDANGQYKNNLHYCICYFSLSVQRQAASNSRATKNPNQICFRLCGFNLHSTTRRILVFLPLSFFLSEVCFYLDDDIRVNKKKKTRRQKTEQCLFSYFSLSLFLSSTFSSLRRSRSCSMIKNTHTQPERKLLNFLLLDSVVEKRISQCERSWIIICDCVRKYQPKLNPF